MAEMFKDQSLSQQQEEVSLLDQAIEATSHTDPQQMQDLLKTLTQEAMKGTITWNKSFSRTIQEAINAIDALMSKQVAAIMHHENFRKLEGSWRGLHYLVDKTETGSEQKIRVLHVTKRELYKDFTKAVEFDQSQIFKLIYESEYGTAGGNPYGVLLGDYEFNNNPEDLEVLTHMSHAAASAFAPFITAPSAEFFGFSSWEDLAKPRDLAKIFDSTEYVSWNSFRNSEDSRFVTMTMPRVMARLPYGSDTIRIDEFNYEEFEKEEGEIRTRAVPHENYCWMNAAYALTARLTDAFAQYGWCTAIRGAEGGGKVENLPMHIYTSESGDPEIKCPTEISITDRREMELSKLGFLPICHYKNTDYAVFFGGQTCQKPKIYDRPEATANAAISARLPYMMATSRFAHFLKVMARDKIGSFQDKESIENWMNRWIMNYVNSTPGAGQEMRAKYPLADARIEIKEIPGKPGAYNAIAWLQPWLHLEELTTSLRLVAKLPSGKN